MNRVVEECRAKSVVDEVILICAAPDGAVYRHIGVSRVKIEEGVRIEEFEIGSFRSILRKM